jgi:hypothetical protein
VLKTKNSSTIHIPTIFTNTANGVFWAAYGVAILDPFIAVPNALGAGLGVIQHLLCMMFPRSIFSIGRTESENSDKTAPVNNQKDADKTQQPKGAVYASYTGLENMTN